MVAAKDIVMAGQRIRVSADRGDIFSGDPDLMLRHWQAGPGQLFVDVGFGPGTWTLVALAMGARTVSFDPKPDAVEILNEQLALNGWGARATVIQKGVWKFDGEAAFGVNSFKDPPRRMAPVVTLDTYFIGAGQKIDCINMDVEWADLEVLEGASRMLSEWSPKVVLEVHDRALVPALERKLLSACPGYKISHEGGFLIAENRA